MRIGLVLAMLAGTLLAHGAERDAAASPPKWQPCPGNLPAPMECTTISVPLDYRAPEGKRIDVAVSRLPATNPAKRRGVLLLNPGGPGGPGLSMPHTVGQLVPRSVTDSYDLIGFDPRGTGDSAPISCKLTPDQLDSSKVTPYPAPDGNISGNVAYAKKVAKQCGKHAGGTLPHITTANTARDMDRMRQALGEDKISYYGVSYGSYLGAVYTTLFPRRSDRIVLDSVVDPRDVWRTVWRHWGPAVEKRFPDFAGWAAQRHPSYELGDSPQAVRDTYFRLAKRLDADPLPSAAGPITGNQFRSASRSMLYSDDNFPSLAKLWQTVQRSDGAGADRARRAAGVDVDPNQSGTATLWSVVCDDARWPTTEAEHREDVRADRVTYPLTNGMPSNIWPCVFWPNKPTAPPVRITDRGPENVLLVQNERDPATPLVGARAMRDAMGKRARLVVADGGDHGAYLGMRNACLSNLTTTFLVKGQRPADTHCGASTAAARPDLSDGKRQRLIRDIHARQFPF